MLNNWAIKICSIHHLTLRPVLCVKAGSSVGQTIDHLSILINISFLCQPESVCIVIGNVLFSSAGDGIMMLIDSHGVHHGVLGS